MMITLDSRDAACLDPFPKIPSISVRSRASNLPPGPSLPPDEELRESLFEATLK